MSFQPSSSPTTLASGAREPSVLGSFQQRSYRPSLDQVQSITPTLGSTNRLSSSILTQSPTLAPTTSKYTFKSPLLEMTLFGLNSTMESTISQNHWRDVTSLHVKQFWNEKYYLSHNPGLNQTARNTSEPIVLPLILVTFTLDFVDTFIDSQTLIPASNSNSQSLLQSLATSSFSTSTSTSPLITEDVVDASTAEITAVANRIQYTQYFEYNQTAQYLVLSPKSEENSERNSTNETILSSNTYTSFFNLSENVPVIPFITPSDVQVYMEMLKQEDPTPTEIFSRIHTGEGNGGLVVAIFTPSTFNSFEPSTSPTSMNTPVSPTRMPSLRTSQRPTMIPSLYKPRPSFIPSLLRTSFQPTRKPTSTGAKVLPINQSVHSTFIAAVVVIVVAGFIIIAWMAWYLFYHKSNQRQVMGPPSDELGGRDNEEDPHVGQEEQKSDVGNASIQPITTSRSSLKEKDRVSTHRYSRRKQQTGKSIIQTSALGKVEEGEVVKTVHFSSESFSRRKKLSSPCEMVTSTKDPNLIRPNTVNNDSSTNQTATLEDVGKVNLRGYWNNKRKIKNRRLDLEGTRTSIKTHESRLSRTASFSSQKSFPSSVVVPYLEEKTSSDVQSSYPNAIDLADEEGGAKVKVVHMIMSTKLR